jgi:serine/threonine protein phosphatase PrpC
MDPLAAAWDSGIEYASLSNIGMRRTNNQDSFAVVVAGDEANFRQRGHLFMVADGMGAHAAGELASKLATDSVPHTYYKLREEAPPTALQRALLDANEKIHERGNANPEFKGMGTTCTALVLLPQGALIAHVGDSRIYRLRGDKLDQLSFDHSLVWEMQAGGKINENDVPSYIPKNIITRSLGPNSQVKVDLEGPLPLAVGDTFLACSDGLTGKVENEEIAALLSSLSCQEAAEVLIDLANLRGGPDNITVVVVRVVGNHLTGAPAAPFEVAAPPDANHVSGVHPFAWGMLAAFVIVAVVLAFLGRLVAAGAAAGGAVATAIYMAIKLLASGNGSSHAGANAPLGAAPYTTTLVKIDAALTDKLAKTIQQLKDAAMGQDWVVDWHRFNQLVSSAQSELQTGQLLDAVRHYSQAIRHMMMELRNQRRLKNAEGDAPEAA